MATHLLTTFHERARGGAEHWAGASPLGMSAAMVMVGAGFPFRTAHTIAEELLRNAKLEVRMNGWQEGALDFAAVTTSWADTGAILADRAVITPQSTVALYLTARPFRVSDTGARSLGGYRDACRQLKAANFPRSKLFDLRELGSASTYVERHALRATDVEAAQSHLAQELADWRDRVRRDSRADDAWESACGHLAVGAKLPIWESGTIWRTPVADLAEGLDLWGDG